MISDEYIYRPLHQIFMEWRYKIKAVSTTAHFLLSFFIHVSHVCVACLTPCWKRLKVKLLSFGGGE